VGPGLSTTEAGMLGSFSMTLLDQFGNNVGKTGDIVKGELIGPDELACAVTDQSNGTYAFSYTSIKHGDYKLHVTLNNEPVDGSPFPILITNAPISPSATFAYGTGLRYAVAGYRSHFTIQGADDFGNNMTTGGAEFNILYVGPGDNNKQACDVTDHGNGQYTVSYVTNVAGDFMISATMFNAAVGFQSIHLSPFMGTVVAGGADPAKSYIFSQSVDKPLTQDNAAMRVVMGVHNYFKIQAVDRYGNRKTTGGDHFVAELEGPVAHEGFISDNGDGTYIGTYVAPAAGRYFLKLYYGNVPVNGTPLLIMARNSFDSCPNGCSKHGTCTDNVCKCEVGFGGADCSVETTACPGNCMGNGVCLNQTCYCFPGFGGAACNQPASICPNECSKHGTCMDGACYCDTGFSGLDCSDNAQMCPDACSGNGECVDSSCLCYPGFTGANCGTKGKFCPKACSGKGTCLGSGLCSCYSGFYGADCSQSPISDSSLSQTEKKGNLATSSSLQPQLPARLPRRPASKH